MRLASIDLGSNTLRMLIAESDGKKLDVISEFIRAPRAGLDVKETQLINPRSSLRILELLRRCRIFWKEMGVEKIAAVATHFSREARNWPQVSTAIVREVGVEFHSISSEQEAELGFLGATYDIANPNNISVIDIGGGSTEFISKNRDLHTYSIPFGALNLTEGYIKSDPPTKKEIKNLRGIIKSKLNAPKPALNGNTRIGIGGTLSSLALLAQNQKFYDVEKVNNCTLSRNDVSKIFSKLIACNKIDREELLPWDRTRAEILPAGTLICESLMDYFGWDTIDVRHRGIVYGLAIKAARE
ncbi:MAG: hypothetical protein A3F16_04930 [Deltaproteobacteria bacterium RIFCSPHIGHO2_12_FULL_43_9]|nr:MAG: hypothetical protein A3F16_04930 [Deltaproteobacteria bacterium RIFCSPHIGHO2_12_FULL_43_9]